MATLLAACFTLVGILLAARSNVGKSLPLTAAIEIAGLGSIETGVAVYLGVETMETFWGHSEHPCQWKQRRENSEISGQEKTHIVKVKLFQPYN